MDHKYYVAISYFGIKGIPLSLVKKSQSNIDLIPLFKKNVIEISNQKENLE
jgi:hypothetical protein